MTTPTLQSVAALYDVHGNISALEAALEAVKTAGVIDTLFGGDLALGPFPRPVLDAVMSLGPRARFIRGNCDRLVVYAFDGRDLSQLPPRVQRIIEWIAAQLETQHRDFLAALPETITLNITGLGEVLFCHATPRSDEEIFTVRTPDARVRQLLEGVVERTVVCGHTHMQFDRTVDRTRIVNAGSVGMPYGAAGAHWLLLGADVKLMRTSYDLDAAAKQVRASKYPDAEEFAERSVLRPASEEEMLRRFEPTTDSSTTED